MQHSLQFHLGVCRASGSETLISLIESLYLRYAPRVYTFTQRLPADTRERLNYIHTHHSRIMDAMRRADAKAARRAMECDLLAALKLEDEFDSVDRP